MINRYDQGDLVRVTGTWTDPLNDDALIDPTTVKLSVRSPDGAVTTYTYGVDSEVVNDSTGIYHTDINLDASGRWFYRWWSTGTGQAAEENIIDAEQPKAL